MKTVTKKMALKRLHMPGVQDRLKKFTWLWWSVCVDRLTDDQRASRFAIFMLRLVPHIALGYDPNDIDKFLRLQPNHIGFAKQNRDMVAGGIKFALSTEKLFPLPRRQDVPAELLPDPAECRLEDMLRLYLMADTLVDIVPYDGL